MPAKKKRRKKKQSAAPLISVLLLIVLAIGALVFVRANYHIAMGALYKKGEPIDLRGETVSVRQYRDVARRCPDAVILWEIPIGEARYDCLSETISVGSFSEKEVENFAYFSALRSVDARAASSPEAVMALIAAYPALEVEWNIPIGAGKYDSRAEEITIGDFTPDEISRFSYFTNLRRVDATAAHCYPEILALRERLGGVELKWNVEIGTESFPYTTKELTVPEGVGAAELGEKLAYLPETRIVDTTLAQYSSDELASLRERYGELRFLYKVTIAGQSFRSTTENITIPESAALDVAELIAHGGEFPELKIINLGTRMLSVDEVLAIRSAYPGISVLCRITVCGKEISTGEPECDLSGRKGIDLAEAEHAIGAFDHLQKLYLLDCGFDSETLDALRSRHEECDIVWRVYLNGLGCRTDADNFCMSKYSNSWGELPYRNAEPIKYCRDMVTLDLGHANFDRIDFVTTMPKLRYLIICSAPVTSLEPLRNSSELYYLEMFFTQVHDLEPIMELPNLRHLNLSHCRLSDYTQLCKMTQLERLWWVDSGLTAAQQQDRKSVV